jgi:hypothetical protein
MTTPAAASGIHARRSGAARIRQGSRCRFPAVPGSAVAGGVQNSATSLDLGFYAVR